jgi:hypothetical protein
MIRPSRWTLTVVKEIHFNASVFEDKNQQIELYSTWHCRFVQDRLGIKANLLYMWHWQYGLCMCQPQLCRLATLKKQSTRTIISGLRMPAV